MHTNVTSRRTLTVTSPSAVAEAWIKGAALKLREEIDAEVSITPGAAAGQFVVVIESTGTNDADVIIDVACDLRHDMGLETTTIKLVDTYGETILDDDRD